MNASLKDMLLSEDSETRRTGQMICMKEDKELDNETLEAMILSLSKDKESLFEKSFEEFVMFGGTTVKIQYDPLYNDQEINRLIDLAISDDPDNYILGYQIYQSEIDKYSKNPILKFYYDIEGFFRRFNDTNIFK